MKANCLKFLGATVRFTVCVCCKNYSTTIFTWEQEYTQGETVVECEWIKVRCMYGCFYTWARLMCVLTHALSAQQQMASLSAALWRGACILMNRTKTYTPDKCVHVCECVLGCFGALRAVCCILPVTQPCKRQHHTKSHLTRVWRYKYYMNNP